LRAEDERSGSLVRNAHGHVTRATTSAITGGKAFWRGASRILAGVRRLLVTPWLWKYALAPVVLAFALFASLAGWFVSVGAGWAHDTVAGWTWLGETGGAIAGFLAGAAILVAALILLYVAFPALVRIVAAPFLALLADRVYAEVAGCEPPGFEGSRFRRWIVLPIRDAVVVLAIRAVITLVALPLNLVPVAGQAAFFAVLLPLEGMDLLDLGLSARAMPLGERLAFVRRNLAAASGLGLGSAGVLFIPLVNVFLLPALVVGAVLLDEEISPDFAGGGPAGEAPA
jgi:CysZ protein